MLSYKEAFSLIKEQFQNLNLETETVKLEDSLHRTLAEDIVSDINLPPFDNSAVDGYAVQFDASINEWEIIGEISAGNFKEYNLLKNQTIKIMTGAKIPEICTAVIPIEAVEVHNRKIKLSAGSRYLDGMNIRRKKSDIAEGVTAVEKGTFLKPRHLASIASCGKSEIRVYKKLKFGILATGDELIPVNEKPEGDKIRVSNVYSLLGEVLALNQEAINFGFINDDKEKIKEKINNILNSDIDILLTTGGVSVGEYDYLKDIFEELGVKKIFWRAFIKPGKPCYFGIFNKNNKTKLVFGLPGNPVSSQVNFKVYIKENINNLFGIQNIGQIKAELLNDLRKKDKKRCFMKGILKKEKDEYFVTSKFSQSSGNMVELSNANCLIVIEEEHLNPKKGERVNCIPM
ncbi:MAG TPA: molybdopterin molybdenumtransferase MoeA [Ignavibacteria bacterium]|nr:molybdopterin molybdenumtransferase MoeA [Ignavibacteria bacterium]